METQSIMSPGYKSPDDLNFVQDFVADTIGKPIDDIVSGRYLEGAAGLAGLFTKPVTMLLTPTDAEAALRVAHLAGTRKGNLLEKMTQAGATEKQIFDSLKLVNDSKNWNHFTSDNLRIPQQGRVMTKPLSAVSNIPIRDSIGVRFRNDLPDTLGGLFHPDPMGQPFTSGAKISVNTNLAPNTVADSFGHELQHYLDYKAGSSHYGYNPGRLTEKERMQLTKQLQETAPGKGYSSLDHYSHNIGEVRARLNGLLNTQPETFEGVQSVFKGIPYHPKMIWGD